MKLKVLITAILLAGLTASQARLGETSKQCEARYGSPVSTTNNPYWDNSMDVKYKKDEVAVEIQFINNKAEKIEYTKDEPFSPEQIKQLLEANKQGFEWKRKWQSPGSDIETWVRSDGGTAENSTPDKFVPQYTLYIRSGYLVKHLDEAEANYKKRKQEQEKKEIEGF